MRALAALGLWLGFAAAGLAQIQSFTVTPGALSFVALDPDTGGPAPQSSEVAARFQGRLFQPWTLYAQAETPSLESCGQVPASALRLRCQSATITSFLNLGSAACNSGEIPLSTTPQIVAQGSQGLFVNRLTVNVRLAFADRWAYPAALAPSCTVSLRYTVDVP